MISVSLNFRTRSSLEEMLESLQRSKENEMPKDLLPALPVRPRPTSRARLPSAQRSLPNSFQADHESEPAQSSLSCYVKKGEVRGRKRNSFGAEKVKEIEPRESPYVLPLEVSDEKEHERCNDNVKYFIEKNGKTCLKCIEKEHGILTFLLLSSGEQFNNFKSSSVKLLENCPSVGSLIALPGMIPKPKRLHIWCQTHDGVWNCGKIKSTSGEKALVLLSDGSVVTVPTQELLPANADILEGLDNLVQLSYLNEPSVLHNLQYRYLKDIIYSKAGSILVAVNPFKDVQLYGSDYITAYRQKLIDSPHVYAVADNAYNELMTDEINQSIIISGESGTGKTETAKLTIQYLVALGEGSGRIDSEILQTSCILEAFGNAKTARNNNSSRFGKLIDIHFNATGQICGAKIQIFLLEKSRVVQLAQGERSYHIFYQLCSGAPSCLRDRLMLKKASEYKYLNQSDCLEIHNTDDAQKFHILLEALNTVKICKEDQEHAFAMLAAVLWLGNISFLVTNKQNHIDVVADEAVTSAAKLIGCSEHDLMLALSTRKVKAGKDVVTKTLTIQQAIDTRDALAKFIYSSLFDWLVEKINLSLDMGKLNTGRVISILDIYGFESFEKNSLEQFCINYTNERLHQHFVRHLLKHEQEKPTGLISLLDEVSNFPKATGLTFVAKLNQHHLNSNHYFKEEKSGMFGIRHYAGEVIYDAGEFLEKNRDLLPTYTIQLLSSCTRQLPQYFASSLLKHFENQESELMQSVMLACQKQHVATEFKAQLFELIQHLESTKPHFIHCIKPNSRQVPGLFEKDIVVEQLQCSGILEVVRGWRYGYPTRMTHQEFAKRYGFLLPEKMACQDPLSMSMAVLQQFGILPEMYQVGYTKLYFRSGQIGALEDVRRQVLQGNVEVQNFFRGHRARRDILELKRAVVTLQSYVRGDISRKEYSLLRLKKQVSHEKLNEQLMAVVQIQSVFRGFFARKHFSHLQSSKQSNVSKLKAGRRVSQVKDGPFEMSPSAVEELQKRVLMAEATLGHKEKENAALSEQVQQFEARCSEYEAKMKSMEEMWQKQISSLQMSLGESKNNLGTGNTVRRPRRVDGAESPHYYDSEDTSTGIQTPAGSSTPTRFVTNGLDDASCRETNGGLNPLSLLVKEFEKRKQKFDDEAQAIIEVRSGHLPSLNPVEEFRGLKHRFEAWKKDYKVRLKEAKTKVHRMGHGEAEKHRRKWWGKRNKRS